MLRSKLFVPGLIAVALMVPFSARAQEQGTVLHNEVSVQGTGFFTKDSQQNGTQQHSTDTGGFLVAYRYHINGLLAAEASYGYDRNTQQSFTPGGNFAIQSNIHEATGALVVNLPISVARMRPYVLAGAGALIFEPTNNGGGFATGAERQTRAAFVYGGGVDYRLVRHLDLRLEYRGFVYNRPDFGVTALNTGVTTHTAQPSAGIVFKF